jgi:hypothetical protein
MADVPVDRAERLRAEQPNDGLRGLCSVSETLTDKWSAIAGERQDRKKFLNTLQLALQTYQANVQAQQELDVLWPRLGRALEIVEEERRQFTTGVLAEIAKEVGRLYEAVHPGEGLNKISLELDPNKRASLEIGAQFRGQTGAPPQAYFSDSHLDTLGLGGNSCCRSDGKTTRSCWTDASWWAASWRGTISTSGAFGSRSNRPARQPRVWTVIGKCDYEQVTGRPADARALR